MYHASAFRLSMRMCSIILPTLDIYDITLGRQNVKDMGVEFSKC